MASYEENEIKNLQVEIKALNDLIYAAVKSNKKITYKRSEYSIVEASQLVTNLQLRVDDLVAKRESYARDKDAKQRQIGVAQSNLDNALDSFRWANESFQKGDITSDELQKYISSAESAQQSLNRLTLTPVGRTVAGAAEIGSQTTEPKQITPTGEMTPELLAAYERRFGTTDKPIGITTPTNGAAVSGAATTPAKVTKKQVTETLTARGLPDTPENRAAIRSELSGKKPAAPTYQVGWEDEVRRQYAKYSWMLDELDREKYRDVFDLLAEAVNPKTKITDTALFLTRFEATSWYKELATQQMGRRVREQVGALSFDSGNYARLLNNAMRYGWEGDNLKAEAYKEVFRRNDDGNFANPNAIGEARKSNDYLRVKSIGTSYLSQMSDDRIVEVLTGGITSDDLLRIYREKAKVNNPHLAAAIDAGVTLEDMAYDYRKTASDVLGTPLSGIPLTEDFVGQALKTGEPGKYRVMSTNEWKYLLKSNPDFGYQYTTNARKEVNDVVSSLEKAFGFVK